MKLNTRRRRYLIEAGIMLVLARFAIRFLPRASVLAWASRPPRHVRRFAAHQVGWVSWAVETVGAARFMNALCLPRALAAHAMLRRRGIVSELCLGFARESGTLVANAWVEAGGRTVGPVSAGFSRVAAFGRGAG